MSFSRALIFALLTAASLCRIAYAMDDRAAALDLNDPPTIAAAEKALIEYCFPSDLTKSKADDCSKLLASLKAAEDESATSLEKHYGRLHTQYSDAQTKVREDEERRWGRCWIIGLKIFDGIAILVALGILITVLLASDRHTLIREPNVTYTVNNETQSLPGKLSFSRVIGLVGGLFSIGFMGFVVNVCLTHLFLTGKMPDQLGTTIAAAVGTLLTALAPYLFNQAFSK